MDLVAGDAREILLAVGLEDWEGLSDPSRFAAYLSLGGSMDATWLDLFACAAREVSNSSRPGPFTEATHALHNRFTASSDRTVERVDPHWIDAVALLPESHLDRIAARWIDLIERDEREVDTDDKPMLRKLAGDLVSFCRRAEGAEDVLFAWTI